MKLVHDYNVQKMTKVLLVNQTLMVNNLKETVTLMCKIAQRENTLNEMNQIYFRTKNGIKCNILAKLCLNTFLLKGCKIQA